MSALKWLLVVVAAGYVGLVTLMYLFQRSLMYFPDRVRTPPAAAGLPQAEEMVLETQDGERVIAWYVAAKEGRSVVLYFHGNGGALRDRAARFRNLVADGTGLVALSYRGYGGSTGDPSEAGLLRDADALYAFAASRYPPDRIVLWGESLGTGVAVAVAAEHPVARVLLESPYTSIADIAASVYRFAPVRWLIKDPFHSDDRIGKVSAPVLVLHGEQDATIPIAFADRLYATIRAPKQFIRLPRADHNDHDNFGAIDLVRGFIAGKT